MNTMNTLQKFAKDRNILSFEPVLAPMLKNIWEPSFFSKTWVPEEYTFLFQSDFYSNLNESQKLYLNQMTWVILYQRTSTGEKFTLQANQIIAENIKTTAPEVSKMIFRENDEEKDHIECFESIFRKFSLHYNVDLCNAMKPGRQLLGLQSTYKILFSQFGVDAILLYYLSRGVLNHIGKSWEPLLSKHDDNPLKSISLAHTLEENQHMATSRLMAMVSDELYPKRINSQFKQKVFNRIEQGLINYQFSEKYNDQIEIKLVLHYLNKSQLFNAYSIEDFNNAIHQHFSRSSFMDVRRSLTIPKLNKSLILNSCTQVDRKTMWMDLLRKNNHKVTYIL
jgi:hypothetical protein